MFSDWPNDIFHSPFFAACGVFFTVSNYSTAKDKVADSEIEHFWGIVSHLSKMQMPFGQEQQQNYSKILK